MGKVASNRGAQVEFLPRQFRLQAVFEDFARLFFHRSAMVRGFHAQAGF
jgi:hypothetical protein